VDRGTLLGNIQSVGEKRTWRHQLFVQKTNVAFSVGISSVFISTTELQRKKWNKQRRSDKVDMFAFLKFSWEKGSRASQRHDLVSLWQEKMPQRFQNLPGHRHGGGAGSGFSALCLVILADNSHERDICFSYCFAGRT
jgi:hypothetical protein